MLWQAMVWEDQAWDAAWVAGGMDSLTERPVVPTLIEPIPIDLGKPRHLYFDLAAVKGSEQALTKALGSPCTFYSAMQHLSRVLTDSDLSCLCITSLSILLWQGCRHEDAGLTLDTVESALPYMDVSLLIPYLGKLFEAWQAASPTVAPAEQQEDTTEPDPLGVSTGDVSGPLDALVSV